MSEKGRSAGPKLTLQGKQVTLDEFKDALALVAYGRTRSESLKRGVCVCCGRTVEGKRLSEEDVREYNISALCPQCFEEQFGGEV